jgi:splicing factor 3A subunit 2
VTKIRDPHTRQEGLLFQVHYQEAKATPRHRFMSAFEQRVDQPPNKNYQYLLFAAEPYEIIGFKVCCD